MSFESLTPEEKYFADEELAKRRKVLAEAERRAAEEHAKRRLGASLGTDDRALIDRIHALGLDGDVVHVLPLLPLIEVAWADGAVSAQERTAILQAFEAHGVEPHGPAGLFAASLLETRPSQTLLDEIHGLLRELLQAKGHNPATLLEACEAVARASGGLFGLGRKISADEREAIDRVAAALGDDAVRKLTERPD